VWQVVSTATTGRFDAQTAEQRAQPVLGPGPFGDQAPTVLDRTTPRTGLEVRHVNRRHLVQEQQLGQLLRVYPIVLALRAKNQTQLAGMGHDDSACDLLKMLEQVAVARRGLETDCERLPDLAHFLENLGPRSLDRPAEEFLAPVIEDADRGLPPMDIQANIPHGKPPFALRELLSISPRRLNERGLAS